MHRSPCAHESPPPITIVDQLRGLMQSNPVGMIKFARIKVYPMHDPVYLAYTPPPQL